MRRQLDQLVEFHRSFEHPYRREFERFLPEDSIILRNKLMTEEVREWTIAANTLSSKKDRAKELADILYVVFGTIVTEGLQDEIIDVFDEVHRSNMSKLGGNGKPIKRDDGKILKGPNYQEPDLSFLKSELV
jgi:predicted HAD superfamily Cof-like phosphohydrolase